MTQEIDLRQITQLRALASMLELRHLNGVPSAVVVIPMTMADDKVQRYIVTGSKAEIVDLLELTPGHAAQVEAAGVPAGWQTVPVHPTPQMIDATFNHKPLEGESHNRRNNRIYAAMLAAAPSAPATAQPAERSASWPRDMAEAMVWIAGLRKRVDDLLAVINAERATPAASAQAQADVRDEDKESEECWSADEENFNTTSLDQLLSENDQLKAGDTVWTGEAVRPDPKQLVGVDWIIENMSEAAYDIAGEHAEDYPDVTEAQGKELEALVADWIKRTCPPPFWTVKNVRPYVLSHDDFPHDPTPVQADFPSASPEVGAQAGRKGGSDAN